MEIGDDALFCVWDGKGR